MKERIVIGLTGKSGSGKSTAASIAHSLGAEIIDADVLARKIVSVGKPALCEIVQSFGDGILLPDGNLDRKKLADIVFSQKDKLQLLNNITHKYIIAEIHVQLCELNSPIVIIDAALLIESGVHQMCDDVWVVKAGDKQRLNRIMQRDGISVEQAQSRIAAQQQDFSGENPEKYIGHVIYNCGDIEHLSSQVKLLLKDKLQNKGGV